MTGLIKKGGLALALTLAATTNAQAYYGDEELKGCPEPKELFGYLNEIDPRDKDQSKLMGLKVLTVYEECKSHSEQSLGRRLALAIWANDMEAFKEALKQGTDEDMKRVALSYATANSKQDMFDLALQAGAEKSQALRNAYRYDEKDMFEALWNAGLSEDELRTVFDIALENKDQVLFDRAMATNPTSEVRGKVLDMAIFKWSVHHGDVIDMGIVNQLLASGLDDKDKVEAMTYAAGREKAQEAFAVILDSGSFDATARGEAFMNALNGVGKTDPAFERLLSDGIPESTKEEALARQIDEYSDKFERILATGISEQTRKNVLKRVQESKSSITSYEFSKFTSRLIGLAQGAQATSPKGPAIALPSP